MKYIFSLISTSILLFHPVTALAQSNACAPISSSNYNTCCVNPGTEGSIVSCNEYYETKIKANSGQPSIQPTAGTYNPNNSVFENSSYFAGVDIKDIVKGLGKGALSCAIAELDPATAITNLLSDGGGTANEEGDEEKSALNAVPVTDKAVEDRTKKIASKEACWDQFASQAGQAALSQITSKTISWVNTGFDGNPLYVRNIDSYLKNVEKYQIKEFLPNVQTSDPIFGNALRAILTKQVTPNDNIGALLKKQMDTPEAKAYTDFMGDFTKGGWSALLNTSNNPLSALFRETANLTNKISTQSQNTREELIRNNGFLDMKKCVEWKNNGQTSNGLNEQPECLRYASITPGSVIASQVETVLNSPVRQTEMVDEINEVVDKFFDKLLNNLFTKDKGLFGMGTNQSTNISFGFNSITGADGNIIQSDNELSNMSLAKGIGIVDISRPQFLRTIIQTQKDFIAPTRDSIAVAHTTLGNLAELDYCIPGPNPTWKQNLPENYASLVYTAIYGFNARNDIILLSFKAIDKTNSSTITAGNNSGLFEIFDAKDWNGSSAKTGAQIGGTIGSIGAQFIPIPIPGASALLALVGDIVGQTIGKLIAAKMIDFYGYWIQIDPKWSEEQLRDHVAKGGDLMTREIENTYNSTTVINAFPTDKVLAKKAYEATTSLVSYSQGVTELNTKYPKALETNAENITELESIHTRVLEIVGTAKVRYVTERAKAGTPVDMACIDKAYVINKEPVEGRPRKEKDTNILLKIQSARDYFYSTL